MKQQDIKFIHFYMGDGVTVVTAPMGEKIYVVEGKERAMVIDTGMGIGSLLNSIKTFCSLPLVVVNTHGHPDHAGCNAEFEEVYLHPDDRELYYKMVTRSHRACDIRKIFGADGKIYEDSLLDLSENILPVYEGQTFDLGGREIAVYKLEGHTKGSIVLYDSLTQWLFVGDAVSINDTWVYLDYSTSLEQYKNSLLKFINLGLPVKKVLSGHESNEAEPDLLDIRLECLNKIISGEVKGEDVITFAGKGKRAENKGTSLIYNERKITDEI